MSKSFLSRLFIAGMLVFSFGFCANALAQTASATDLINAEILSNVWYSTTAPINQGDTINIYAGFQNHSLKNLSGTAGFYVDDLEIKKVDFTASPKSLIKLETKYTAVTGSHKAQVKILDIKEIQDSETATLSVDNLLAKETEKKDFSVVEPQLTQEAVLEKVANIANTVVNKGNQYADTLANYMESLKTPTENSPDSAGVLTNVVNTAKNLVPSQNKNQEKVQGEVLGASTEYIPDTSNTSDTSNTPNKQKGFSFYNPLIDIAVFLIHQWVWVLTAILLFILYLIFT